MAEGRGARPVFRDCRGRCPLQVHPKEARSAGGHVCAISFSKGSSQPRNRTRVSCTARQILSCLNHQGSPGLRLLLLLLLSHFSRVRLCATPQTAAYQASPSLGFSRQEHWNELPFPSPMHESEVAQSCPTLSDPMDCSFPGSSVHGILWQPTPVFLPRESQGWESLVGCLLWGCTHD